MGDAFDPCSGARRLSDVGEQDLARPDAPSGTATWPVSVRLAGDTEKVGRRISWKEDDMDMADGEEAKPYGRTDS